MLAAVVIATIVAQAPTARQTPPQRYRLEVKTLRQLDQSSLGKPNSSDGLVTTAIISVTMRDTTGGQIARVTVDSMALSPTGAVAEQLKQQPTVAQDARGGFVQAYIVHGRIQGAPQFSDSNLALGAVAQAVGVLFPGTRQGVKVGDSWADTSKLNNSSGARRVTGEVIAKWKVVATDGTALVLDGVSTSRALTEDGSGQTMTLTGDTKEHLVIPSTGPARRATIETSSDMSITAPQLAHPIPGKNTGSLTLTPLP